MRTIGLDLAADPARTGMCEIDWSRLTLTVHQRPITDERIVAAVASADVVGMDVPLGWPDGFIEAISDHRAGRGWPPVGLQPPEDRLSLRFRLTDLSQIAGGSRPLSVSTDRIGVAAMRGARLQHMLVEEGVRVDRSGVTGSVVETYPAAALRTWGLQANRYKGATNRDSLGRLVADFAASAGSPGESLFAARDEWTDDDFDSVICAVVARAARRGQTTAPGPEQLASAQREGWIHAPTAALAVITG